MTFGSCTTLHQFTRWLPTPSSVSFYQSGVRKRNQQWRDSGVAFGHSFFLSLYTHTYGKNTHIRETFFLHSNWKNSDTTTKQGRKRGGIRRVTTAVLPLSTASNFFSAMPLTVFMARLCIELYHNG